jgi:ADP-ribose pyrophosphatase
VVVIPVDLQRDEVVMLRQFRLGAHLAIGRGELVELPAGHVEVGEAATEAARRECLEEIGVAPDVLVPVFGMLPSPGMSDEHQTFFLGVVDAAKIAARAGAAHEHEDTRPFRVAISQAIEALAEGRMQYGATVLGLQWLALNRTRLAEIVRGGGR